MPNPLRNTVIHLVGTLPQPIDRIRGWIKHNGGRYTERLTPDTTHVIASKEAYKKNGAVIKEAKEMGNVWIVDYEWLDDCLMKGRKLKEAVYSWEEIREGKRVKKKIKSLSKTVDEKKFKNGCAKAKIDTGSGTSTSTSYKSKNTFFVSALDDLKTKREAREAEEKAAREAEAKAAAVDVASGAMRNAALDALKAAMGGEVDAAKGKAKAKRTVSISKPAEAELQPKLGSKVSSQRTQDKEAQQDPDNVISPSFDDDIPTGSSSSPVQPKPSLFPPSLNFTLPSASRPKKPTPTILPQPLTTPSSISSSTTHPATIPAPNPKAKMTDLYHIYVDNTGFAYDLILLRRYPALNNFAHYTLRLYESHTKPHVYCTFVRYVPPGGATKASSASNIKMSTNNTIIDSKEIQQALVPIQKFNQSTPTPTPIPQSTLYTTNSAASLPEPARLASLITPPSPSPSLPYKSLPTPPNSPFITALSSFRHIFRDLTLLTWEERTDNPTTPHLNPTGMSTQRLRAQERGIEPFIWKNRPLLGQGYGVVLPRELEGLGDKWDGGGGGYIENRFGIPGLGEKLGIEGEIGSALFREQVFAKKRKWEGDDGPAMFKREIDMSVKRERLHANSGFGSPASASPSDPSQSQNRASPYLSSPSSPHTPIPFNKHAHTPIHTPPPPNMSPAFARAIGPLGPAIFTNFNTKKKRYTGSAFWGGRE